jgi:hypothetical protein
MHDRLVGECACQFVVGQPYGFAGSVLQTDHPARAGGLVEDHTQEGGGPALGLAEAGHEQAGEGDQPRSGLPRRDTAGQRAAGGTAARAEEPVLLIFGDDRLDFREFPDLMAERLGIGSCQGSTAPAALDRHAGDGRMALLGRDQGPLVFRVADLAPGLS